MRQEKLEERQIPGPEGAPDVSVLILRPAAGTGPWPGVYHTHGGGMVLGTRRTGAEVVYSTVSDGMARHFDSFRIAPARLT